MSRLALFVLVFGLGSCAAPGVNRPATPPASPLEADDDVGTVGVLVMAHGGDERWNATVDEAVAGLPETVPVELAYGMANPFTLGPALERLSERGVERVALVRAFLSGQSFVEQTEWYLGLSDQRPENFVLMGPAAEDPGARAALDHDLSVRTHRAGILDSPLAGEIMVERAREVSDGPERESVLLLAHGMGDEGENDRVLAAMDRIADGVAAAGFVDVRSTTLREDWAEERARAEKEIRSYVRARTEAGDRVLVLPVRLTGFGPYAGVLEGLEYVEGRGLMPHPLMGEWILRTANQVSCNAGWGSLTGSCSRVFAEESSPQR